MGAGRMQPEFGRDGQVGLTEQQCASGGEASGDLGKKRDMAGRIGRRTGKETRSCGTTMPRSWNNTPASCSG